MEFSRKNRPLYIDTEALSTLALVQEGLISPVTKLMNNAKKIYIKRHTYEKYFRTLQKIL